MGITSWQIQINVGLSKSRSMSTCVKLPTQHHDFCAVAVHVLQILKTAISTTMHIIHQYFNCYHVHKNFCSLNLSFTHITRSNLHSHADSPNLIGQKVL